eukprot:762997-Hanusia_phi.AAC.5
MQVRWVLSRSRDLRGGGEVETEERGELQAAGNACSHVVRIDQQVDLCRVGWIWRKLHPALASPASCSGCEDQCMEFELVRTTVCDFHFQDTSSTGKKRKRQERPDGNNSTTSPRRSVQIPIIDPL